MHSAIQTKINTTHGMMVVTQVHQDSDGQPMRIAVYDDVVDFLGISDWEYELAAITVENFRQENKFYYYSRRIEEVNGDEAIASALEAGCRVILLEGY